jgi:hypothetical protein
LPPDGQTDYAASDYGDAFFFGWFEIDHAEPAFPIQTKDRPPPAAWEPPEGDDCGHVTTLVPFAGITRIRCGGFDLSPAPLVTEHPCYDSTIPGDRRAVKAAGPDGAERAEGGFTWHIQGCILGNLVTTTTHRRTISWHRFNPEAGRRRRGWPRRRSWWP